jgi:hypothetical protein
MGRRGSAGSLGGRRVADDAHARWWIRRGQRAVRRGARSNRCSAKLHRNTSNDARLDVDEYETLAIQYSGPGALQDHPGHLSDRGLLQPGEAFYTEKQDQEQEQNRNRCTTGTDEQTNRLTDEYRAILQNHCGRLCHVH